MKHYDVIVIGSGPGGSLTSAMLAQAGLKVLTLEKGKHYSLTSCKPFTKKEMLQKYKHGGITVALGEASITYVEGECVGGGSEINSGLYHRLPEQVLQTWVDKYKVFDLSLDSLSEHYEAIEEAISISYMPSDRIPKASKKLEEGAQRLNWNVLEVPRWHQYSSFDGVKQSMTETYIPDALSAGVSLKQQHNVKKIRKKKEYWEVIAEDLTSPKSVVKTYTSDNVFVCAGAISTAILLKKNGLSSLAGNQLHLHPTSKIVAEFSEKINNEDMGVPVHQVKEFSPRISLGCSISSKEYLKLALQDITDGQKIVDKSWERMAVYYAMTNSGLGKVKSLPFFDSPLVQFELGEDGVKDIREGLIRLSECLFAAGAKYLYPAIQGAKKVSNIEEMIALINNVKPSELNLMTIHLFSTCPMGENDNCVTDSYGKVKFHEGLYVNDGSLLCTSLGVNPQGTILAIARRNVTKFLKDFYRG